MAYNRHKQLQSVCSLCPRHQSNFGKEGGYADSIYGVIYGQHLYTNGMKDIDCTMMLITKYVTLEISGNVRNWRVNRETVRLNYPEIVRKHYTYQYAVGDHNNCLQ